MSPRFKLTTTLFFALLAAAPNQIRGSVKGEIQLGFKAGGRLSTFTGADTRALGGRYALSAGFFGNYAFGAYVSMQCEANYAAKGSRQEVWINNTIVPSVFRVDYVEFPVLMRLAYTKHGPVVPRIFLGPTTGILVRKEAALEYAGEKIKAVIADVRSVDIGLTFGVAVDVYKPNGVITFDLRFTSGISKLMDTTPQIDRKNVSFALQAGYAIIR